MEGTKEDGWIDGWIKILSDYSFLTSNICMPFSSRRLGAFPGKGVGLIQFYTLTTTTQIQAHLLSQTGRKENKGADRKGARGCNGNIYFKPQLFICGIFIKIMSM